MKAYKSYETINKIIVMISKQEKGAYVRFGDGDLNIIGGINEQYNKFNINAKKELIESITIDDIGYLKGFCLLCNKYNLLENKMWPGNHEWPENRCVLLYKQLYNIRKKDINEYYTPVAFNYYLTTYPEKSFPLMKNIRDLCLKNSVIFIGNNSINKNIINLYFGKKYAFIESPSKNSYDSIDNIEKQIFYHLNIDNNYKIIIICCGVTTRCLAKRIWKNNNVKCKYFILDLGSIIDALSGNETRQYILETKFNHIKFNQDFINYL